MKKLPVLAALLLATLSGSPTPLQADASLADLANQALSPDPAVARAAQDELRNRGPEGLQALATRADQIHTSTMASTEVDPQLATAFNRVGAQYDNAVSQLYWYTDLDQAKAAAKATGRPILSLRLLGRLDEDLSCANSRFFRTTLYPQAIVSSLLRDKFILHWESVRPAPRVTIDFGDGRKLERTITGNSIHYVLDADGKIIDALPGLYSATTFVQELQQDLADDHSLTPSDYPAHQLVILERLDQAWAHDLATLHIDVPLAAKNPVANESLLAQTTTGARWQAIAQLHAADATLDASAQKLISSKFPDAATATTLTISKCAVESPLLRALRNLQGTIALDTVRNNYLLRGQILEYVRSAYGQTQPLASVNDWVYANIFLTPKNDPWLGLSPNNVFSAIDHNGQY